jgi:methyltransferase (TIGR00027 family)
MGDVRWAMFDGDARWAMLDGRWAMGDIRGESLEVDVSDPLVRNISDTALWVAHYRAEESERPDAVFRDPYARALAGERGAQIASAQPFSNQNSWSFVARTYSIDRMVADEVRAGADVVVNLAAGLDTRPYRMDLPASLRWIEMDLGPILDYKEGILGGAQPVCRVERIRVDLADSHARRQALTTALADSRRALALTEGLLIYLDEDQVSGLARDLHDLGVATWILDISSPALLKMLRERGGGMIAAAGAPYKFAPENGPDFFVPLGWKPVEIASLLKTAGRLKRLTGMLRFLALLPDPKKLPPPRPWGAIVRVART